MELWGALLGARRPHCRSVVINGRFLFGSGPQSLSVRFKLSTRRECSRLARRVAALRGPVSRWDTRDPDTITARLQETVIHRT